MAMSDRFLPLAHTPPRAANETPLARAVLIGRPYLWALAVNGEAGVAHVLQHLHDDLKLSMALAGCPKLSDIGPQLIR